MPDRTNDEIPELIEDQPEVAHDEGMDDEEWENDEEEQETEPSEIER